ncbi:hypothetical protein FB451DRAFT_1289156 [Mycena latifolia]|nr:hypothetical protein FB451DRAFT_1289156 [Mycena latifolia]
MPALAAELVDLIISWLLPIPLQAGNDEENFLDKSTAADVGTCALVCRSWVPSSRRALFYRVHVARHTADAFAKLLSSPTFLPFIRELEFREEFAKTPWINTVFPFIATHLSPSIRTVVLSLEDKAPRPLPPCPVIHAITHLVIQHKYAPILTDIVACLASFPALEVLKLWLGNSTPSHAGNMVLPRELPATLSSLRSFDIRYRPDMEPLLTLIQQSCPIEALALSFPRHPPSADSFRYLFQYIETLGPSLTSLSIAFDDLAWHESLLPSFPRNFLSRNNRLQALSIRSTAWHTMGILRSTHFSPVLKCVTVWVPAQHITVASPLDNTDFFAWYSLDLDPIIAPLSNVDRLHIVYYGDIPVVAQARALLDGPPTYLRSWLPRCDARGIVTEDAVRDQHRGWWNSPSTRFW